MRILFEKVAAKSLGKGRRRLPRRERSELDLHAHGPQMPGPVPPLWRIGELDARFSLLLCRELVRAHQSFGLFGRGQHALAAQRHHAAPRKELAARHPP